MSPSLTSPRLHLVAFQPDDVEELHEIFSDPQTHTIGSGPFRDVQQTEAWITRRLTSRRDLSRVWATVRPANTASLHVLARIGMTLHHHEEDDKGALLYLSRVP